MKARQCKEKKELLEALADLALLESSGPDMAPSEEEIAEYMRESENVTPEDEAVLKSLGPDFMKKISGGEIQPGMRKPFNWRRFGERLRERLTSE